jgi:hypothetical protein
VSEVFYCPNCADYSADREGRLSHGGYPLPPLCKHCGAECEDLANEPRMEELANLVKQMGEAREEYRELIEKVQDLTNQIRADYKISGELL